MKSRISSRKSQLGILNTNEIRLRLDDSQCNLDEDIDNEYFTGKNIKDGFVQKLKDFSAFNPSGLKGIEKMNNSMMMVPSAFNKLDQRI